MLVDLCCTQEEPAKRAGPFSFFLSQHSIIYGKVPVGRVSRPLAFPLLDYLYPLAFLLEGETWAWMSTFLVIDRPTEGRKS